MNEKQVAGEKAAEFIQNGMIFELGTGSTGLPGRQRYCTRRARNEV